MPMHCTGIGKALLANSDESLRHEVLTGRLERRTPHTVVARGLLRRQLDTVLETGVAFEREESALGISCVAAAVLGPDERAVAAISVTGSVPGFRPEAHVSAIRAAAAGLGATLARRSGITTG
jgi:DNA-binding IclR family transcriptional regulator